VLGIDECYAGDALVQLAAFGEVKYPLLSDSSRARSRRSSIVTAKTIPSLPE
jgi:hypothetical protein